MIRSQRISLCLPCRNEANHLSEIIAKVPEYIDEIIIISNNSSDNTYEVAKSFGGRVKALEDNRTIDGIGYGFAHMSGIAAATGDIIIGADGDGTYPIEDSEVIVGRLLDEQLDFISCNRYPLKDQTKIPFKLRLGVQLLNWEVRLLYGLKINDILSGMWVFKRDVANDLKLTMGEWNLSPQIKINAARNSSIHFAEHSIIQHNRLGETKQNYFKTGYAHAMWIAKNRFSRKSI